MILEYPSKLSGWYGVVLLTLYANWKKNVPDKHIGNVDIEVKNVI
jgi:hypothetical protein